jgi:hypothetical protein
MRRWRENLLQAVLQGIADGPAAIYLFGLDPARSTLSLRSAVIVSTDRLSCS